MDMENTVAASVWRKVGGWSRGLLNNACARALLFAVLFVLAGSTASADLLLSWTPGPISWDPNQPQTWRIYRRTVDQPMSLLTEIAANAVQGPNGTTASIVSTAIDTTVTLGTLYCYQVSAWNTAGESTPTAEACAIATDGQTVALQIPASRIPLVSRRATDGSTLVSILANKSDVITVNNSQTAPTATIVMQTPADKTVLVSRRSTDGSQIVSILVNASQAVFINGLKK